MRPGLRLILGTALAAAALAAGCAPEPPADPATENAVELFALARGGEPDAARVDRLFDARRDERWRAALYDALAELARAESPAVAGVEPLGDLDRTAVDVAAGLPGGGEARYSVQLERRPDGSWKIVAFHGPDVSWPPRAPERGPGTSSWPDS